MTITDAKTIFKNYLVLIETHNEQKHHIRKYFEQKNIRCLTAPMFTADYTFLILPNHITGKECLHFGNKFLIERKSGKSSKGGGFSELRNNLTKGHAEFKAEFQRMNDVDNVILLIENAESIEDLKKVDTRSHNNYTTFEKIFNTFIKNRNSERKKDIQLVCTPIEKSGECVMKLIYEYIKKCV